MSSKKKVLDSDSLCTDKLKECASRRLCNEFTNLCKEMEDKSCDIRIEMTENEKGQKCLNEWDIYIKGPDETLYEGFILHAKMAFPSNYPYKPPSFKFITPTFHPNIYADGNICISILHTDNDDPASPENCKYTWTAGLNVRTVCLSITSLLSEPNIYSPANVDASKMLRDNPEQYKETVTSLLKSDKNMEKYRKLFRDREN